MARSSLSRPPLSALPALPVALAFAAGILIVMILPGGRAIALIGGVIGVAALTLLFFQSTRRLGLLGLIALAGATDLIISDRLGEPPSLPGGEHIFRSEITTVYPSEALALRLTAVDTTSLTPSPEAMAIIRGEIADDITEGYAITFRGTLTPPDGANDSIIAPYGDHPPAGYFYLTPTDIIASSPAQGLSASLLRCRSRLTALLMGSSLSAESKEFLATALLGLKGSISSSTRQAFARAGLAHILALSGLHLAIIAGLFYWLLAPLVLIGPRPLRSYILIILIWAYTLLTGLGAPVVRAAVMTTIVLLGDILQRRSVSLNSLFAAATIILIVSPGAIADVGFQLTVAAVGAIITLADALNPFASSRSRFLVKVGEAVGISTAAMLATGLIAALRFHSFPLLFLPANILLTPVIVPLLLGCGIFLLAALLMGLPCGLLIRVIDILVELLDGVARFIASLPVASIPLFGLSPLTVILVIATLTAAAIALWPERPRPRVIVVTGLLSIGAIISACFTSGFTPAPQPGSYIALGRMRHAAVIIPSGPRLWLLTDAPPTIALHLRSRLEDDLADYMGSRRLTSLTLMPDTLTAPGILRRGAHLLFHGRYLRIISRPDPSPVAALPRPDVALVVPGFYGSPDALTDSVAPGRAVISSQLNSHVRRRLTDSLAARGIPFEIK